MDVINKFKIINIIGISLIFLFSDCESKVKNCENQETYSILSLLISENTGTMAPSIPPPTPLNLLSDSLYLKKRDSVIEMMKTEVWKNKRNIVAIDPYLFCSNRPITLDSEFSENYTPLLEKFKSLKEVVNIDIEKIIPTRGNTFIKLSSPKELQKLENWNKFNEIFNCSRIVFNRDCTRALAIIGITRSKLDGYSSLVLLKKINGNWVPIHYKALTIS